MYLSRLVLTNYRNLEQVDLELAPGVSIFFGDNAQGKTALLEAAYTLAIARSFRANNEREVVAFQTAAGGGQALVGGTVHTGDQRLQVFVGYQALVGAHQDYSVRKQIRVSRVRRTAAELVGLMNAVLFSAVDIDLVQGPPSVRRRYLDILISQADPIYLRALQRYQRVVQQRNRLLRVVRDGRAEAAELAFWDIELASLGSQITLCRQEVMKVLSQSCWTHHRELVGVGEDFRMEYRPNIGPADTAPETESRFRESLAAQRQRELATSTTVVGPHRDDFRLLVNDVDMGMFASRGQARTLALSLRLGEAAYLSAIRGESPIVLLDDVLSELDSSRRRRVLEKAGPYQQVLITATDPDQVRQFFGTQASYFHVTGGKVVPFHAASVFPQ